MRRNRIDRRDRSDRIDRRDRRDRIKKGMGGRSVYKEKIRKVSVKNEV